MDQLTTKEAYEAMMLYLINLQKMTNSDDLAEFLSGMSLLQDGTTADAAAWEDWLEAVQKVKDGLTNEIYLNFS